MRFTIKTFISYTSLILKGSFLILLPVRSKIALHNAGANGGNPGSLMHCVNVCNFKL